MTRFFIILLCLLGLATNCSGQEISPHEADSMLALLSKIQTDTGRMELLLNLAQFHINKPGENKADLDSAAVYINEAKSISKNIKSVSTSGYLLFTEACLVKERGPKISVPPYFTSEKSRKMLEDAIKILESGTNPDYLGRACYELSTYYEYEDSL